MSLFGCISLLWTNQNRTRTLSNRKELGNSSCNCGSSFVQFSFANSKTIQVKRHHVVIISLSSSIAFLIKTNQIIKSHNSLGYGWGHFSTLVFHRTALRSELLTGISNISFKWIILILSKMRLQLCAKLCVLRIFFVIPSDFWPRRTRNPLTWLTCGNSFVHMRDWKMTSNLNITGFIEWQVSFIQSCIVIPFWSAF